MVMYRCPLCGTEGFSMDEEKRICPECGNGSRSDMPGMSFRVSHIGKKKVDTTAKRGIMEAEEKSCR